MRLIHSSMIVLLLGTLVLAGSIRPAVAGTDVSVSFSSRHWHRHSHGHGWHHHSCYSHAYVHHSPWRHHYVRPYRYVTVAPVVVTQAVYVQPPVTFALSDDYGRDLADFREKLNRLRTVVQRQRDKGSITHDAYDRFRTALEGLERDQQDRAFNQGGNLTADDFAELYRRMDQVDADIERALAG